MITGVHALIYTDEAEQVRAFFRDALQMPNVDAADQGFGLVTAIKLPGGGELGLYQPKHPVPPRS